MNSIEPFYNDLSNEPLCSNEEEAYERLSNFAQILKICYALGIRKFRFDNSFKNQKITKDSLVFDYLKNPKTKNDVVFILGMGRKPYIDDDTPEEAAYVNTDIKLLKEDKEIDAYGLTCAYLSGSFSIGFASEAFWKDNIVFRLKLTSQKRGASKYDSVFCISEITHLENPVFIKWFVETVGVDSVLKYISIPSGKKKNHLRDDHGKKELEKVGDIILKESYLVEVVNSLPFDGTSSSFIERVEDNLVYLRFYNSDKGYGMVVRTKANGKLFNLYFAEDIRRKYEKLK